MKAIPTYLSAGHIGAFIKLFPVVSWLVKERRELAVIRQIPTHERLGIAFAKTNVALCEAVNKRLAISRSVVYSTLYAASGSMSRARIKRVWRSGSSASSPATTTSLDSLSISPYVLRGERFAML